MRGPLVPFALRFVVLIASLAAAGCTVTAGDELDPVGPGQANGCRSDASCGSGNLCARNGECLPASQVREVHVMWTLRGQPAGDDTCAAQPDLQIRISATNNGDQVDYSPVPCVAGKFSVDKLPTTFDRAELGPQRGREGWRSGTLDREGNATLDLPF